MTYKPVKVDRVVQDYMDSLLADLFPAVETEQPGERAIAEPQVAAESKAAPALKPLAELKPSPEAKAPPELMIPAEFKAPPEHKAPPAVEPAISAVTDDVPSLAQGGELTYPHAPSWAQQEFDVLLFDVCGLKLAVNMEALGRIIKVEHELNQLIGRPSWFMGAYTEAEQSLYVVDTAKFIMPEKGFDLSEVGFDFIIQLQRSHWSLACKEVYSTVRIQPDQVKWRSTQGKRPWLAGTVIEHMCALIHVDSLVSLLERENAE